MGDNFSASTKVPPKSLCLWQYHVHGKIRTVRVGASGRKVVEKTELRMVLKILDVKFCFSIFVRI